MVAVFVGVYCVPLGFSREEAKWAKKTMIFSRRGVPMGAGVRVGIGVEE